MAVRASREIVIEAPPEAIMNALADVGSLPSYTPDFKCAEVLDTYRGGRPHHVHTTVKVRGRVFDDVLEYHWGPNWLVFDSEKSTQRYSQHVEYSLRPDYTRTSTTVGMEATAETDSLIPEFPIERVGKSVIDTMLAGLRRRVFADKPFDQRL
ncbi:cyclase [Mycobacteriaceae bacterium 1482268.1]|nr:cyclase [Mycobacteriaceae bacterium 1482268.1]